jgi:hypothetical protein
MRKTLRSDAIDRPSQGLHGFELIVEFIAVRVISSIAVTVN